MDKMVSKIKSLEKKVSGSSSKKKKSKAPHFPRSRSLLTTPRRLPAQEPHRASLSSQGKERTTRREGGRVPRRSSSTTRSSPNRGNSLDRAEGRVDLEEPCLRTLGFEYDSTQYQDFSQTSGLPTTASSEPTPPRPRKPHPL
ncbi:unnamed protein product [Microthlaspi erraticum]|uniref:Uncharacterized protein n=1 Tax=Microthlaspi erraticum TaxID=1685480 RepID=A0A6D2JEX7_9BRAS|nr:unnamed protein product [Microthlaspi erraticum]